VACGFDSIVCLLMTSLTICSRFLPIVAFPIILPSIMSHNSDSCLKICPIHLSFRCWTESKLLSFLSACTVWRTAFGNAVLLNRINPKNNSADLLNSAVDFLVMVIFVPACMWHMIVLCACRSDTSFPTPMEEPKKIVRCHYLGTTLVHRPTGY